MDKNVQEIVSSIIKDFGQDKLKEVCQLILDQGLHRIPNLEPSTAKKDNPTRLAQLLCKAAGKNILEVLAELNQPDRVETAYCPFCGEEVEFDETEYDSEGGFEKWYCPECHAHGKNIMSAPKFLEYDELYDGNGNAVDSENLSEVGLFSFKQARQDVIDYLSAQDEEYFFDRGRTKAGVLADTDLIDELAAEHHKCVFSFGNDRKWSVKDACDDGPGIWL